MDVRYWIDGISIFLIAILLQLYTNEQIESAIKQDDYGIEYYQLAGQLQNETLTEYERGLVYQELQAYQEFWTSEASKTLDGFERLLIYNLVLSSYMFKNIAQIAFAFLRNKRPTIVIPELCMNAIGSFLTLYILLFYWFDYSYITVENEDFKSVEIIYKVSTDKHIKFQFT